MPDRIYSIDGKIQIVERIIENLRWARAEPDTPEHDQYTVMKTIAKDLRQSRRANPSVALAALTEAVTNAEKSKSRIGGHPINSLQEVAWALMEHWPEVKRALERQSA